MPIKDINDFEEFKNYGRIINASCVISGDFEARNKKRGLINGGVPEGPGKTRLISEQYANSFSYTVHWIDTDET